jgi:hypothetical protein
MIRAGVGHGLASVLLLVVFPAGCRRAAPATDNSRVDVAVTDSALAVFKDTVRSREPPSGERREGRTFDLRAGAQRDSLRALLKRERARWQSSRPREYRFLVRVSCFCPGQRGWLLMEVRDGQPLQARDRNGKIVALGHDDTFSIDGLFDNLERSLDRNASVQVSFDPRWHFPASVSTRVFPGPDAWGLVEVTGFRPSRATR